MTTTWPRDTFPDKVAFYGDFREHAWATLNLVHVTMPFQMYYAHKPIASVLCHHKIADALKAAMTEIWEGCAKDQDKVNASGASDYGGCFNVRKISGSYNYSNHSWACAIDLSPESNGFNEATTFPRLVIDAFKRQGARWGGDYHGRKDPMHFEFVSPA